MKHNQNIITMIAIIMVIGLLFGCSKKESNSDANSSSQQSENSTQKQTVSEVEGVAVTNEGELAQALGNGQTVTVTQKITITNAISVKGDVAIHFTKDENAFLHISQYFRLEDGANLTIHAENKTMKVGRYGVIDIPARGKVVLNGGIYTANTLNGTFININDANDVEVILNNVTYQDDSGFLLDCASKEAQITINGGSFTAPKGFAGKGNFTVKNATINTEIFGFEIEGNALIDNCTISVHNPDSNLATLPEAVSVTYQGYAKVSNCNIDVPSGFAYYVYSTGGKIDATNNTGDDGYSYKIEHPDSTITIDGVVYAYGH